MLVSKFIILWGSFCLGTQGLAVNMKYPSNGLRTRDDSTSEQSITPGKQVPEEVTKSNDYKNNEVSTALKALLKDQRKKEIENDQNYIFAMYEPEGTSTTSKDVTYHDSCDRAQRYASLFSSKTAYCLLT